MVALLIGHALLYAIVLDNRMWFYQALSSIVVLYFVAYFITYNNAKNNDAVSSDRLLFSFRIDNEGVCQFSAEEIKQLLAHSMVHIFGFQLMFVDDQGNKSRLFIFKDSLSAKSRARLARIIKHLKKC